MVEEICKSESRIAHIRQSRTVADPNDREAKKATAPHIRQEEPTKYRCKECNKLFKAPEFVVKHVSSKHPELLGDKLDNVSRHTSLPRHRY